ncbi:tetratricopeptide repeat protein [Actinokineospora auranticolor]|uniref:Tetratricopeptide repeat protein n=1 Tax=Actinokineospora auranticolor TaxID=155976 RepID=A0A2S6GX26_9PSEU|nr:tetratricopeptide repeat protein [Actinokineospora auranticolor]PPK69795.1 tetratricopeptide repeat protein [Actinokineospora auranticolor]
MRSNSMGRADKALQAGTINGDVYLEGASRELTLPCWFGQVPPLAKGFQKRGLNVEPGECVVLCGMGGLGKTQLAADYAEQARGKAEVIAWITAASRDDVVSGLVGLAAQLSGVTETPDRALTWVLSWLATTTTPWLLIFDDVWDPLDDLWPRMSPASRMVVTTRREETAAHVEGRRLVPIDLFTPAQSQACLSGYLADRPHLLPGAEQLVETLGHLPLAIGQAGAFMADRRLSCEKYLTRWHDRSRTLKTLFRPETNRAVAVTWSLSIERANELEPTGVAEPMLQLTAMLDPNGIPLSVLTSNPALKHLSTEAGNPVTKDDAWDALACLARLSLITFDEQSEATAVRVHALVQRATREQVSETEQAVLAHIAADALLATWPEIELDASLGTALRANTAALAIAAGTTLWKPAVHPVLFRAGNNLGQIGQVASARDYFEALHESATRHLGPDHPDTLITRHDLAYWHIQAGDAGRALAELDNLLPDLIRVLGPDHPKTLSTRHNLAYAYSRSGDTTRALTELDNLLPDLVRILGPDHLGTLATRHSLAQWHAQTGDAATAVTKLESILLDVVRVLGPDHPHTLTARHNLAYSRGEGGDMATAVTELEAVLADRIRVLGPDHPSTLTTRHNLAYACGKSGDTARALTELESLLPDRTRVLGPDHPNTVSTRRGIAYLQRKGRPDQGSDRPSDRE